MKFFGKKSTTIALIAVSVVLLIAISVASTLAYLSSRRSATGYLKFASGVLIDYKNVDAKSEGFGNLYQYVDSDNNGLIDDGELINLNFSNIQPGDDIVFANPKLLAKEGTVPFALRIKFVVTDKSNPDDIKKYTTRESINALLNSSTDPVFASGTLEVDHNWRYNRADGYYYLSLSDIQNSMQKIEYSSSASPIYIFNSSASNKDIVPCKVIDGEPLERFPIKDLQIELYIEAIEFSSVNLWFE